MRQEHHIIGVWREDTCGAGEFRGWALGTRKCYPVRRTPRILAHIQSAKGVATVIARAEREDVSDSTLPVSNGIDTPA